MPVLHWVVPSLLLVALGCSRSQPAATDQPNVQALPTVTAEQLLATVRGLRAKAVLVNVWATWCDSCQHELPMLQSLREASAQRGVEALLVSVDEPEDRNAVSTYLKDHRITLRSYLAARPLAAFKAGLHPRWPGMLPASFLFDGVGKLRYFWGGEAYEKEITPVVDGLLAGKNIDGEANFGLAPGQTTDPR